MKSLGEDAGDGWWTRSDSHNMWRFPGKTPLGVSLATDTEDLDSIERPTTSGS